MGECKDCRFWQSDSEAIMGQCSQLISIDSKPHPQNHGKAYPVGGNLFGEKSPFAIVTTAPDFGCNQFAAKG